MNQASSSIKRGVAGLAAATAVFAFVGAGVAQAADADYTFYGFASGAQIGAQNSPGPSWEVGSAGVFGGPVAQSSSDSRPGGQQAGVISVGAVTANVHIARTTGGWQVVSTATAGNVSLLGGAVTARSVTTRTGVSEVAGKLTTGVTTTFVDLHIAGTNLPVHIPANYRVRLGNRATVLLNARKVVTGSTVEVSAASVRMTLLKPVGTYSAGTEVSVTPSVAVVMPAGFTTGHTNVGHSYGSRVTAPKGSTMVGVRSAPTAPVTVFTDGTDGKVVTNNLATTHLAKGLQLGSVSDSGLGTNDTNHAMTITTSKITAVNLFDGAIRADSVTANASASSAGDISGSAQLVNLFIGGKPVTLTNEPNMTISVLNLGRVILNQQIRTAQGITVRAMFIVLDTARDGLPVGAKLQIGVAQAAAT